MSAVRFIDCYPHNQSIMSTRSQISLLCVGRAEQNAFAKNTPLHQPCCMYDLSGHAAPYESGELFRAVVYTFWGGRGIAGGNGILRRPPAGCVLCNCCDFNRYVAGGPVSSNFVEK